METIWIPEKQLSSRLERNEAFWRGELEDYPLMWVYAPACKPGPVPREPEDDEALWTDVDYVVAETESRMARTHFAGDSLPVHNPWLGPDQFAAWLGAKMTLKPRAFTSWVDPFVDDWADHPDFTCASDNPWWRLYLRLLRASVEAGRGKWVTAYPDLHSGIDALSALRGPERLSMDLLVNPEPVTRAMGRMTALFKFVVDEASSIILPAGQGTSNWTMGWSEQRYLCIGQNDYTCMIGPEMFDRFVLGDIRETVAHVDISLYHLDGPGALPHLPRLLEIAELNTIQWIQGAGAPPPSRWLNVLRKIQDAGKCVQVFYGGSHGGDEDLRHELDVLCAHLDPTRLFFWAETKTAEEADALVEYARGICRSANTA